MKIKDDAFFRLIRDFLTIYLPRQKCYSKHTIKSYRETFNLLLDYLKNEKKIPITQITFKLLNHSIIADFLDWLRTARNCELLHLISG